MFSLTIVFGPSPMVWTLMFKTEETAREAYQFLNAETGPTKVGPHDKTGMSMVKLVDDFGQETALKRTEISGSMLENLEQSRLAHIERALHQARTQAKGAEIADNDPVLKQARHRAQGGMPMIQPVPGFGPNGRFPS